MGKRVIGTTAEAIDRAEQALGRSLPPSFRSWLLANNGLSLEYVNLFPVLDDRDPRKTWDSIVRNFEVNWRAWLENFSDDERDFSYLLPFADSGSGDFYCFDYSEAAASGEAPVVLWSHETGETEGRAETFAAFVSSVRAGEIQD